MSDTSLFTKKDHSDIVILLLYVDDIILTGSNPATIQLVIKELHAVFDLKDLGKLTYFLGLLVKYQDNGDIFVNQAKYIKDLIHKAGIDSCKPTPTPCKPHSSLLITEVTSLANPSLYKNLVGSLQYLTFTRPYIAFAVNFVCQYMTNLTDIHLGAVKRIIRYLQGTIQAGIVYSAIAEPCLSAFSEYKALAHAASDIAWVRNILKDFEVFLLNPHVIFCDNMSAIALSANPVFHLRIKHLDTDYHLIRERVQQGDLEVTYVLTDEHTAEIEEG
ncbi:unnamed protein product [Malus baccata var. baccata]